MLHYFLISKKENSLTINPDALSIIRHRPISEMLQHENRVWLRMNDIRYQGCRLSA